MKASDTYISLKEIRDFYKDYCKDEAKKFSEEEFEHFVDCCERDFYQWLSDNLKYFRTEYKPRIKKNKFS